MVGVEILGGMAESEPVSRDTIFRQLMAGVEMLGRNQKLPGMMKNPNIESQSWKKIGGISKSKVTRNDEES